jgi:hypothetical protein
VKKRNGEWTEEIGGRTNSSFCRNREIAQPPPLQFSGQSRPGRDTRTLRLFGGVGSSWAVCIIGMQGSVSQYCHIIAPTENPNCPIFESFTTDRMSFILTTMMSIMYSVLIKSVNIGRKVKNHPKFRTSNLVTQPPPTQFQ